MMCDGLLATFVLNVTLAANFFLWTTFLFWTVLVAVLLCTVQPDNPAQAVVKKLYYV